MLLADIEKYFKSILNIDELKNIDNSYNGVQVGNLRGSIKKIAFAVDACLESFKRAKSSGAELLFVHHGMMWNKLEPIIGNNYERMEFLIQNNLALFACHLPLDMNPEFGNNIILAKKLELENIEPFGMYKGKKIGFKGSLKASSTLQRIISDLEIDRDKCLSVFPFGKKEIKTIGIVSGGAAYEVEQAIFEDLDLYITGEMTHSVYFKCMESKINMISAGHYNTEIFGVKSLAEKAKSDLNIETVFLDIPTGL